MSTHQRSFASFLVVLSLLIVSVCDANGNESLPVAANADHFQVTTLAPDLLMLSTDQGT